MSIHIAAEKHQISKTVFLVGDPMRCKLIAEKYLTDAKLVNEIRGAYYYTGKYKGKEVTVGTSGMGSGSMGIYAYELFNMYDVDVIVRMGSCGSYDPSLTLSSVFLATESQYDSDLIGVMNCQQSIVSIKPDEEIINRLQESAKREGVHLSEGKVHSTDLFYIDNILDYNRDKIGAKVVEMESFSLFIQAKRANKKAGCLLTVSDDLNTFKAMTSEEREKTFDNMIRVGLGIL